MSWNHIRVWRKPTLPVLMMTEVTVESRWGKLLGICGLPASWCFCSCLYLEEPLSSKSMSFVYFHKCTRVMFCLFIELRHYIVKTPFFLFFFFLIEFAICCCSSCSQSSTWREDSRFVCSTWGQNYTYCNIDAGPGENVVMAGSSQIVTAAAEGNLGNKTCPTGRLFCCMIHHIQFSWQIPVRTTWKQSSLPIQLRDLFSYRLRHLRHACF